jgi:hypothetical protein
MKIKSSAIIRGAFLLFLAILLWSCAISVAIKNIKGEATLFLSTQYAFGSNDVCTKSGDPNGTVYTNNQGQQLCCHTDPYPNGDKRKPMNITPMVQNTVLNTSPQACCDPNAGETPYNYFAYTPSTTFGSNVFAACCQYSISVGGIPPIKQVCTDPNNSLNQACCGRLQTCGQDSNGKENCTTPLSATCTASPAGPVNIGTQVTFSVNATGGAGNNVYNWPAGTNCTPLINDCTVPATTPPALTMSVSVEDNKGVFPNQQVSPRCPSVAVKGLTLVCKASPTNVPFCQPVTLSTSFQNGTPPSGTTYIWSVPCTNANANTSGTCNYVPNGSQSVSVTSSATSNSAPCQFTVAPAPTLVCGTEVNGVDFVKIPIIIPTAKAGDDVVFNAEFKDASGKIVDAPSCISSYKWAGGNGVPIAGQTGAEYAWTVASNLPIGLKQGTVTPVSSSGSQDFGSATCSVTIVVPDLKATCSAVGPSSVPLGKTVQFKVNIDSKDTGVPPYTYAWGPENVGAENLDIDFSACKNSSGCIAPAKLPNPCLAYNLKLFPMNGYLDVTVKDATPDNEDSPTCNFTITNQPLGVKCTAITKITYLYQNIVSPKPPHKVTGKELVGQLYTTTVSAPKPTNIASGSPSFYWNKGNHTDGQSTPPPIICSGNGPATAGPINAGTAETWTDTIKDPVIPPYPVLPIKNPSKVKFQPLPVITYSVRVIAGYQTGTATCNTTVAVSADNNSFLAALLNFLGIGKLFGIK